jgi:hypothetical protein
VVSNGQTPEYWKAYREANRERLRANQKKYRERVGEKFNEGVLRSRVKRMFGVSLEEYLELRARPCEICGRAEPEIRTCIDHTVNGTYHGVLCNGCNSGIGLIRHDPVLLERAASYVRRTRRENPAGLRRDPTRSGGGS